MSSQSTSLRGEWRLLLFGFVMMFCSSPGQTYFIALFSGQIRADLSLSHGEFGAIYSIATLASAVLLLWSATLLDRLDLRKFSLGLMAVLAIAAGFMSIAQNVLMLGLAIFMLRHLGQGLTSMTSSTSMMRYLAPHKAKANSIASMGYSSAEATLPTVIIFLLTLFTWREAWQIVGLILLLGVPLILSFLLSAQPMWHRRYLHELASEEALETSETATTPRSKQWTRAEVIRDPYFYLFAPALMSQSMLYTGFMFHQVHLVAEKGWSLLTWGSLYALFSFTTIGISLVVGILADRVGAVRLAPFVTAPMALGLLVLSSSSSTLTAAIFMVLMGCSTGAQAATSAPFFAERYGNKNFGAIKSLASFLMVFMTAVSPVILGVLIDNGVAMNAIAQGAAVYAFFIIAIAYVAYRRLLLS